MNKFIYGVTGLAVGAALSLIAVNAEILPSSGLQKAETNDQTAYISMVDGNELTQAQLIASTMSDICTSEDIYGTGTGSEDETSEHMHAVLNVNAELPEPTLNHIVYPDKKDGYNIQILTQNFSFTPAKVNNDSVDNQGHAHLYINGEKIARLYSHWYHIPSSMLETGMNYISITLNANDHSEWAVDDVPISSTVRVVKSNVETSS